MTSREQGAFASETLAEAIEELARGTSPAVLIGDRLAQNLRAATYSYGWLDASRRKASLNTWPEIADVDLMLECTRSIPMTHPILSYWLRGARGTACVSRLVAADLHAWLNSEAYAVLQRGMGCTETVGIRLDAGATTIEMLGFARDRDFTDTEVGLVESLQMPTIALHRHARWLSRWNDTSPARRECVDELGLTPREMEVLQLLSQGLLATSMAARLAISPRTVHRHLGNIYMKLGTHDRLSTVMFAHSRGLLPSREPTISPRWNEQNCGLGNSAHRGRGSLPSTFRSPMPK